MYQVTEGAFETYVESTLLQEGGWRPGRKEEWDGERALFPNLQIDQWRGYGHFLMMEDPVRFNRRLMRFLTEAVK